MKPIKTLAALCAASLVYATAAQATLVSVSAAFSVNGVGAPSISGSFTDILMDLSLVDGTRTIEILTPSPTGQIQRFSTTYTVPMMIVFDSIMQFEGNTGIDTRAGFSVSFKDADFDTIVSGVPGDVFSFENNFQDDFAWLDIYYYDFNDELLYVGGSAGDAYGYFEVSVLGSTSPIPLPASLPLSLAALAGLGCIVRRRAA